MFTSLYIFLVSTEFPISLFPFTIPHIIPNPRCVLVLGVYRATDMRFVFRITSSFGFDSESECVWIGVFILCV